MSEDTWYSERRSRWKPDRVKLLLVAESAPDSGGIEADRRFFYDENLTSRDGLFRQIVHVLFDAPNLQSGPSAKAPWLKMLQDRGVFLIDLASEPVNHWSSTERHATLQRNIDHTVRDASELAPAGIVLVKKNVFELLNIPLRSAGLNVLHDAFIPFPASGQQARFRERFRLALKGVLSVDGDVSP